MYAGYKAYYTFVPNEDNEFVAPDGAVMQNTPQTNQGILFARLLSSFILFFVLYFDVSALNNVLSDCRCLYTCSFVFDYS